MCGREWHQVGGGLSERVYATREPTGLRMHVASACQGQVSNCLGGCWQVLATCSTCITNRGICEQGPHAFGQGPAGDAPFSGGCEPHNPPPPAQGAPVSKGARHALACAVCALCEK